MLVQDLGIYSLRLGIPMTNSINEDTMNIFFQTTLFTCLLGPYLAWGQADMYASLDEQPAAMRVHIISEATDDWNLSGSVQISAPGDALPKLQDQAGEVEVKQPEVMLADFHAKVHQQDVSLKWLVTAKQALNYFVVERSQDLNNWQPAGTVLAPQLPNRLADYEFLDKHPQGGSNYYRLKQVDAMGQIRYSDVIVVERFQGGYHITNLYPQPEIFGTSIDLHLERSTPVDIRLLSQEGEVVGTIFSDQIKPGKHTIEIDMNSIQEGRYTCEIKAGNSFARRTLVK